jgi:glycosyltransferase involved in cell wall biosynthesis
MDFAYNGKSGNLVSKFQELNCTLIPFQVSNSNPADIWRATQFLRQNHYDIICSYNAISLSIMFAAYMANIPKRIVFIRNGKTILQSRFQNKLLPFYQLLNAKIIKIIATHILSNSQAAMDYYFPNIRSKNMIVRNGVDFPENSDFFDRINLKQELGIPENAKVVGHIGNFRIEKNHKLMLKVASVVCEKRNDVVFFFCGRGVPDGIQSLNPNIKFIDQIVTSEQRSDVFNILTIFDVFFFPSLTEGQPNALLEAMGMGIPFLASDHPAIIESIRKEDTDQLFPADDVESFSNKILEMLDCPWHEKRKISMQQTIRERFKSETNFRQFLEIFKSNSML